MPRRDGHKPSAPAHERRRQAWELYKAGQTNYTAIGRALGVSAVTARAYILKTIEQAELDLGMVVNQYRAVELERLDTMLSRLWPKVLTGDVRAQETALRIGERRAKLLGLDKPFKLAQTDPEGKAPEQMTAAELQREIMSILGCENCPRLRERPPSADGRPT